MGATDGSINFVHVGCWFDVDIGRLVYLSRSVGVGGRSGLRFCLGFILAGIRFRFFGRLCSSSSGFGSTSEKHVVKIFFDVSFLSSGFES